MEEKTILLVEDDLDTREALDDLLSEAGYEVIPATSGKQAIEYLLADPDRPPDAVVLDLMLPLVSGWQVLELIRADSRLAGIPVVVTTGVSADRPPGATVVLKKPIDAASFVGELDHLTAAPHASHPSA
jgi:two-component system response regulator (stage 0 sporulation protein F)